MSYRTLSTAAQWAFVAGECAAFRLRWMQYARDAKREGLTNLTREYVAFARKNSRKQVRFMRNVRRAESGQRVLLS